MANERTDQRQWFLRIATGTVFGPVSTKGLVVWAEQGRVVPGNELSTDRENWVSADAVPELEMNWHVEDGVGKVVGPFNRIAAEAFLKSGKAPPGAHLLDARRLPSTPHPPPAAAVARPPSDPPPETPDPRDLRIRELEKDARARDRKLEALKQEMINLQEAQAAASRPTLTLAPEDVEPVFDESARDRIEEVRRAAEDERRCLEREIELLRVRNQELQQAAAASRKEVAADQDRATHLDARVSELASLLGQRETECHQLKQESETLRQQLGIAMSAATDATNETGGDLGELRRKFEQLQAVNEGLRSQLEQADQTLAAERAEEAELLAASNERDRTSQQQIDDLIKTRANLEAQLTALGPPGEREARLAAELAQARTRVAELQGRIARTPDPAAPASDRSSRGVDPDNAWVRQFATDELSALDKVLEEERAAFNALRQLSASRQETIQNRMQHLQHVLSGDGAENRSRAGARERIGGLDTSRIQSEMESLRSAQQREARQFEDREAELLRRIRVLETEDVRLRSQREASDMQGGRLRELMETVRRREQELALERKNRDQERQQLQSAQQALLKRIEELESGSDAATARKRDSAESGTRESPGLPRRLGSISTWLHR